MRCPDPGPFRWRVFVERVDVRDAECTRVFPPAEVTAWGVRGALSAAFRLPDAHWWPRHPIPDEQEQR